MAEPRLIKITLKNATYEISLATLTGRERLDAKRLLEVPEFFTNLLIADEIGMLVLAYLAARRVDDSIEFDQVLELNGNEVTVDFTALLDEQQEDGGAGPFDGSTPKASRSKTSAQRPSPED